MIADGTAGYTTEVVLPVPDDIAAQSGIDEVTLTGEGWYDMNAPAWGVTMDMKPFLEVGGPIGDLDATVTATWIDDTYFLTSDVIGAFTGGQNTVASPTIDELAINEDLATTPLGSLTLPLLTNPIGEILSIGGTKDLAEEPQDDGAGDPLVTGQLPLIGAYREVVRMQDITPPDLDGEQIVHDTHVVQFGIDPDPVLEDFEIEIGYRLDEGRLGFTSQFIDYEKAIPFLEDELDDAESLAGTSVRITNTFSEWGSPFDLPGVPPETIDVDTAIRFTADF
jgi:hypothetical protein